MQEPDLSVDKSAPPGDYETTDTLTYTIGVANAGPGGATDVTVSDVLPNAVTYESATPSSGADKLNGGPGNDSCVTDKKDAKIESC